MPFRLVQPRLWSVPTVAETSPVHLVDTFEGSITLIGILSLAANTIKTLGDLIVPIL